VTALVATATIAGAAVLGVVVPWLFIAMLVPSLESSERARVTNYRGATVVYGLGVVWLVWAGCAMIGGTVASSLTAGRSVLAVLTLAGPLALVAFALGAVDDAYGSSDARGFRGHVKAMLRGRMTTGGLKLIGIGTACLVVALVLSQVAPWGGGRWSVGLGGLALVAGAAIALTSNFVNLTDLRPGRALKAYSVLALLATLSVTLGLAPAARFADVSPLASGIGAVSLALFLFGPVIAVWGYDLGERGMLGDAGANPMGAVAGMLIVVGLPAWGLIAYFVVMLARNLASERFSFSRVIASNRVLSRVDMMGRSSDTAAHDTGPKSSQQQDTNPE
jgi:hypothetical protein